MYTQGQQRQRLGLGLALALVLGLGWWTPGAQAVVMTTGCAMVDMSCTLAELFAGGTITINDKEFDNWIRLTVPDSDRVTDNLVLVTPLDDPLNPGLEFSTEQQWSLAADVFTERTYSFRYTVATVDGIERIRGSSLRLGNHSIDNTSEDYLYVTVCDLGLCDLTGFDLMNFDLAVYEDFFPGSVRTNDFDSREIAPLLSSLNVFTSIIFANSDEGVDASVELNSFEQRFAQIAPSAVIPEPGTLILLGTGLAGALGLGWWRRHSTGSQG